MTPSKSRPTVLSAVSSLLQTPQILISNSFGKNATAQLQQMKQEHKEKIQISSEVPLYNGPKEFKM